MKTKQIRLRYLVISKCLHACESWTHSKYMEKRILAFENSCHRRHVQVHTTTVTPDRTMSGSYDWLRFGQGARDQQYLLRSPVAVVRSPTVGEDRWLDQSCGIVRLVVTITDRSYGQSLRSTTDRAINRGVV